jgi:CheY-like chemotaxis protein
VLDLNANVENLIKMLRRLIGEDIDLSWLPPAGLGLVMVDPTQIDQILANPCVNARDAIGGVGKITIETRNAVFDQARCAEHPGFVAGEYVMLSVSDNGCGMDKETLAHIFEPFFTTKGVGEGTGLGLATAYGIVMQNNGSIQVKREPGHGTTFNIYLPRHGGQPALIQTQRVAEPARRAGETLLLVEDEQAILAISTRILEWLGYTVLTASTPDEAIRLAGQRVLVMLFTARETANARFQQISG